LFGGIRLDDVHQDIAIGEDSRRIDAVTPDAGGVFTNAFENISYHHP
jgi:hypothetical protein